MTDVMKLMNRESSLRKQEEEGRERFVSKMRDCNSVLQLMSQGGYLDDTQQHSPCRFCGHKGKESCPNGSVKFGFCPHYTARLESPTSLENEMLMYLRDHAQLASRSAA